MKPSAEREVHLSLRAKRILTIVFAILPVLLVFASMEIYLRVVRPLDDLWALTGRKVASRPLADWAFLDAFSANRGRPGVYHDGKVTKTVNRHGFISTPEMTEKKPDGTIRIAFLGESSTAGTGTLLPDAGTWPWLATEKLRQHPGRKAKLEFLNAALGGFSTFESFGRLWSRVRFFSPDIVVVYHGWNEMYYFKRVDTLSDWRTLPDGSWGLDATVPVTVYEPRWFDYFARPSQLLTKVRLRMSTPLNGEARSGVFAPVLANTYDQRAIEVMRTNLRLIKAATEVLGMQLLVGKQATLIVPGLAESEQRRCGYDKHGFDHAAHVDAFQRIYRVIDEEFPTEQRVDVTSLSGVPENFHDHIHPTPLGSERTATIMAAALEPMVQVAEAKLP